MINDEQRKHLNNLSIMIDMFRMLMEYMKQVNNGDIDSIEVNIKTVTTKRNFKRSLYYDISKSNADSMYFICSIVKHSLEMNQAKLKKQYDNQDFS